MDKIFYIADTHFNHANIIRLDNRPYKDVLDMGAKMLENWNNAVGKDDIVYILGDFMWKFRDEDYDFAKQLNGRKILVKGNHDKCHNRNFKRLFGDIVKYEKIVDNGTNVVLSHYPMLAYDGSYNGRNVHLFGHVHTTDEGKMVQKFITDNKSNEMPMRMYNVGCMMPWMDYTPRTLDEILANCE